MLNKAMQISQLTLVRPTNKNISVAAVLILIIFLFYQNYHKRLEHFKNYIVDQYTTSVCPNYYLNDTKHWPALKKNVDKEYTPSSFCLAYKVPKSDVYKSWPLGLSDVPTSLKNKTDLIRTVDVLRLKARNRTLEPKEQEHLNDYYDCKHGYNYSKSLHEHVCDEECVRFRQLLRDWPCNKPKALIYILTRWLKKDLLKNILHQLDLHFNNQFQYPIVLFVEKGENFSSSEAHSWTNASLFIQTLSFKVPTHIQISEMQNKHFPIPYRHMCWFQAKGVYDQPILDGVEYAWRLDDDSEILAPIRYDVFAFMKGHSLSYGYVTVKYDSSQVVIYLWEATCKYVDEEYIRPTFFYEWEPTVMFNNNFEISDLSIWRSCSYKNYIDYIDRLGGIYYYRWGDAPIKSIAVSLMVPKSKVHKFKNIAYRHQGIDNNFNIGKF